MIGHELGDVRDLDIRFSLLVGVLVGLVALSADFFLRFTMFGGGRRSRIDRDGGGGGRQRGHVRRRYRPDDRRPDRRWPAQLAVKPWREDYLANRLRRVDPRSSPPERARWPRSATDKEVLSRRSGDAAPSISRIRSRSSRSAPARCSRTHPAIVDRINRLRCWRRIAPSSRAIFGTFAGLADPAARSPAIIAPPAIVSAPERPGAILRTPSGQSVPQGSTGPR